MGKDKNVVLVTIDALRADHVYGSRPETPILDTFSENGLTFSTALANGCSSRSAFPAIVTGTHAWQYGGHRREDLRGRPHVAEELSEAGYATGGFHSNAFLVSGTGYERGFDEYFDYEIGRKQFDYFNESPGPHVDPTIDGHELNREAIRWLRSVDPPVFCWLHYMDIHFPYRPVQHTASDEISYRESERLRKKLHADEELTDQEWETVETLYRGQVEYVDECLGALFGSIAQQLPPDETVVIITADHGELLGENGRQGHVEAPREEILGVPLIVRDSENQGTVRTPVSGTDVVPTVLSYANVDVPDRCEGQPLQPGAQPDDRYVFAHVGDREDGELLVADEEHVLVRELQSGDETFLETETWDRLEPTEVPSAETLRSEIDAHYAKVRATGDLVSGPRSTDPQGEQERRAERLRALGYRDPK